MCSRYWEGHALFLGIDIGTSGVKAVLISDDGSLLETTHAALSVSRPHPLWSEQDPADWWRATQRAVLSLSPGSRASVSAIGLSGQMHGATLLDETGSVLRPAILWNDGRSADQCGALETALPTLGRITGNRAMPGFTAPKLLWVREHEPDIFAKIAKVLLPKDYIRLCMTGDYASDMSDSAGTLWLDVKARSWSTDVLKACGLTEAHMPTLNEGSEITGHLSSDVAREWGMSQVPVAAGGGDNAAGAVGSGVIRKGEGFLSLGTSGVIFLADDAYRPDADGGLHTFCHALPGKWHQMAVMLSAASAVDWVALVTGYDNPAALYSDAATRGSLTDSEVFLPYLSGERTPYNDPNAKGVFFGLTHNTDRTAMAQAALEGVAFGLADGVNALRKAGAGIDVLSVIGGGARSDYWGRILAAAMDVPLTYRESGTVGPAYGAARLAMIAVTNADVETVCQPPPISHVIEPDPDLREQLAGKYETYKTLYTGLSAAFQPA